MAYLRCSGWRKTRQAPKSPPSITRRSSALFSIQAKDIWAAGWRSPSTRRSASLAAASTAGGSPRLSLSWTSATLGPVARSRSARPCHSTAFSASAISAFSSDRGKGAGGERLVDPEDVDQGLAVKTQADEQRTAPRPHVGTDPRPAGGAGGDRLDGGPAPPRRW